MKNLTGNKGNIKSSEFVIHLNLSKAFYIKLLMPKTIQ